MNQFTTVDFYNHTYLNHNPSWHVEDAEWKAQQILKIITKNNLNPLSVGEVGCGVGEILRQLHLNMPSQTNFIGYEVSSAAIELAQTRRTARLDFYLEDITQVDNIFFDIVLCIDVFEHVPDYLSFLKRLKTKAQYKIFHIPLDLNIMNILRTSTLTNKRKHVGHLHYFTKQLALEVLRDLNYKVIDHFYTPFVIGLSHEATLFKRLMYRALYKINQDSTVRLLGGSSLLVLAE
jgi:hypothetical protein